MWQSFSIAKALGECLFEIPREQGSLLAATAVVRSTLQMTNRAGDTAHHDGGTALQMRLTARGVQVHAMVNLQPHQPDPASCLEVGGVAMTTFYHALEAAKDGSNEIETGDKLKLKRVLRPLHKYPQSGDDQAVVDDLTEYHPGHDIHPLY